ncbi:hypothetical protein RFI_25125 [Reticulomyxa filosa]|uniref:Uncharacterized protein n=1 Tax=Reticulomyxa filosa TaxID=46433 RepID=X6ME10_RETFI|nr:hypothetical protein RFI_25125 [Reticulomyxa filosa]|eukprot:ETO12253.1 hypothetical protein RFI_25125 [Reticulomyxa filosa]
MLCTEEESDETQTNDKDLNGGKVHYYLFGKNRLLQCLYGCVIPHNDGDDECEDDDEQNLLDNYDNFRCLSVGGEGALFGGLPMQLFIVTPHLQKGKEGYQLLLSKLQSLLSSDEGKEGGQELKSLQTLYETNDKENVTFYLTNRNIHSLIAIVKLQLHQIDVSFQDDLGQRRSSRNKEKHVDYREDKENSLPNNETISSEHNHSDQKIQKVKKLTTSVLNPVTMELKHKFLMKRISKPKMIFFILLADSKGKAHAPFPINFNTLANMRSLFNQVHPSFYEKD